jgi:hypothetical protein
MSELYAELEQERARLRSAEVAQQARLEEQRRDEAEQQTVAASKARIAQLEHEARVEQFEQARVVGNAPFLQENQRLVRALYEQLDRLDLTTAQKTFAELERNFASQQQFKRQTVAQLNDEFTAAEAAEEQRQRETGREDWRAAVNAGTGAWLRRMNAIQNAIAPGPALGAYIHAKPRGSNARQVAVGLAYALTGSVLEPANGYSAQAGTDAMVLREIQNPTVYGRPTP